MSNNEWQIFDSTAVAAGRYDKIEQVLELALIAFGIA